MPQASGLQFTARVGEFPSDHFVVVGFALTERLSDLFHGRLQLASTDPDVAAADVLEQPVDLVVWQDGQPLRRFTGVVNEFMRGDTGHRRTRYEVVIQPPLWRLGLDLEGPGRRAGKRRDRAQIRRHERRLQRRAGDDHAAQRRGAHPALHEDVLHFFILALRRLVLHGSPHLVELGHHVTPVACS